MWSHGREVPGFVRFYPGEVQKLADEAAAKMAMHLLEREQQDAEVRRMIYAYGSPNDWSLIRETSPVRFDGMPGAGPLDGRIQYLAERFPRPYGACFDGRILPNAQKLYEGYADKSK
jgi:hypothetical protein